jgi:hypothetical protein
MNNPAASSGVSSSLQSRHSVLDTESSRVFWIPVVATRNRAFAGMTNSRQAAGNEPQAIQVSSFGLRYEHRHRETRLVLTETPAYR